MPKISFSREIDLSKSKAAKGNSWIIEQKQRSPRKNTVQQISGDAKTLTTFLIRLKPIRRIEARQKAAKRRKIVVHIRLVS